MNNSTDSIAELFQKYGEEVFRTCWLYLKNRELAEDAAMDTFLNAMRGMERFHGGSSQKTWLIRIAINNCKNILKSSAYKTNAGSEPLENIAGKDEFSDLENKAVISEALSSLPDPYREAAVLHFYNGFTIKECAKIAKVPQTAMAYRVKRAKELLRDLLSDWYFA